MNSDYDIKDLELKKHVASIHCSNTLSLLQRKISNVLLYHAYDELLEKEEHEISMKTLCSLIGYSSHDYDTIKKALKALISTVLEWNLLGDAKGELVEDWNASSMLACVGIKGGICTYSYSNRLKKLLYMPEIYGRINIAIQARFKSSYALALYENCIRYQNLPYTRWFALATFRKLMGVPENKYIIFRDFKRRVLDKSIQEVNDYSDIFVESQIERDGQKVNRIRFLIRSEGTEEQNSPNREAQSKEPCIMEELLANGFNQGQARVLLEEYSAELIFEKIRYIKASPTFLENKVKSFAAYLKTALKENYLIKPESRNKKIFARQENVKKENLKKQHSDHISQEIDIAFEKLDPSIKKMLTEQFEKYLTKQNNTFVLAKYHSKGLLNHIVRSVFRAYLRENYEHYFPNLPSYEKYEQLTD